MKIQVEIDFDVNFEYGDDLTDKRVKEEIIEHLEWFRESELDDLIGTMGKISIPSTKCWDCYSYITLNSFKLI